MRTIHDAWGPEQPELTGLLGGDVPWRFWTPEVIRAVAGGRHCAMPPLPHRGASLWRRVEAWGPLLPLLHFHLGWPRVDVGLSRWAATGFDPMDDPTLKFIRNQWGQGLAGFVLWSAETSGAPKPTPLGAGVLAQLRAAERASDVAGPSGLHLENHWSLDASGHWSGPNDPPSDESHVDDAVERREGGEGQLGIIVSVYNGWYRLLTAVGDELPPLASGRSWRVRVTIAPIGFVGEFRKSRDSGRWFTGRHRAHALGVE